MSRQRSLEQDRAQFAWDCVVQVRQHHKSFSSDYGSLAKSAPANIQSNGLGQTLSFWRAKARSKPENQALYEHVSEWVKKQLQWKSNLGLLEWIMQEASTNDYRRATAEAMAFLQWLKRFAEAELDEKSARPQETGT